LDAGLKHPSGDMLGVDAIVPDISYLESRKQDVIGILLSHAHDKHVGALPMVLKAIAAPVFGTKYTIAVVKDILKDSKMDPEKYDFRIVDRSQPIQFPDFQVEFFSTTHSIPESSGFAILTEDGVIVYATDFTFDQNMGIYYETDFAKLTKYQSMGVLALMSESSGALSIGHSSTDYHLTHTIRDTFKKAKKRIIVAMYSTELSNIQKVVNEAVLANKKISIIGRKAQRLVDIGETLGYIQIPKGKLVNLKFLDETNQNDFDDVIFLVTGERHEPFYMLQRMAKGIDRLLNLKADDTVVMLCPPIIGTEKIAAKTYDALFRIGLDLIRVDKKLLSFFHASTEDIKLLYNLLRAKYIVPITGEYRYQMAQKLLASEYGYPPENIVLLDNGEVITLTDGVLEPRHDMVMNGSIMIDGNFESDVNDTVLKERELLGDDGFVMIVANIDSLQKQILNTPEIVSRGFMYMRENEEVVNQIKEIYKTVTEKQFSLKTLDWRVYKETIRYEVQKYLYQQTKRKPVIIPVIIDTQHDRLCREI
jgi:ribonuclease J